MYSNSAIDPLIVDVGMLSTKLSTLSSEKEYFNSSSFNSMFSPSYINTSPNSTVQEMADKARDLYTIISSGYESIVEWWNDYNQNVIALEDSLVDGYNGSITDPSVSNIVSKLPELGTYHDTFSGSFNMSSGQSIFDSSGAISSSFSPLASIRWEDATPEERIAILEQAKSARRAEVLNNYFPEQISGIGGMHYSDIPRSDVVEIIDLESGKSYNVFRYALSGSHIDVITASPQDTEIKRSIAEELGLSGSEWAQRPVLMRYDGHVIYATIHRSEHATGNRSTGMNGHVCLHFEGTTVASSWQTRSHRTNFARIPDLIDGLIDDYNNHPTVPVPFPNIPG